MEELCNRLPFWLRWLALPLTPVLTFGLLNVAGNLIVKGFGLVLFPGGGGTLERFLTIVLVQFFAAAVAVEMTGIMAPKGKSLSVFFLCGLNFLISGFGITWYVIINDWKSMMEGLPFLAGVAVAGLSHCEASVRPQ